jgi:hypothetical protein
MVEAANEEDKIKGKKNYACHISATRISVSKSLKVVVITDIFSAVNEASFWS